MMQSPIEKQKNRWWDKVSALTQINTTDTIIKRKGQLLAMFFALIGILSVYMLVDNSLYLILHPSWEYAVYVMQDVVGLAVFYGLWKLNQSGRVQLAAYLVITAYILITVTLSPPSYLEYLMVVFALPIGISSFLIRPSSSFVFAFLTTIAFAASSMYWGYEWQYNLIALLSLFALAFMTWVISWRLEYTLQENVKLVTDLKKSNAEIRDAYETTLEGWSLALDLRDQETEGHTQRVTELTVRLARAMGIGGDEIIQIRRGALLHDIGKIGVPDSILLKSEQLNEKEWEEMRHHPRYAYSLLYPIPYLRAALDIPTHHHEKWDGSGYPQGLKGEEIPFAARIFAIVDVYDALLCDRPYRKAWEKSKVLDYIREQSGKHFDPQVTDAFLKEIGQ